MASARPPAPRIRRRLAIAFMVVAGLAAGALAVGSYLVVREARLEDAVDRSLDQTRFNLLLAADALAGSSAPADARAVVATLRGRGDFETVALAEGAAFVSGPTVSRRTVPSDLRGVVRSGQLGWQRVDVAGTPYLVAGGRAAGTAVELYFFFSEAQLRADLRQLGQVLAVGWVAVVAAAGLVGSALARRALAPVAAASARARRVAEELLGTRLPAERDEFAAWAVSFTEMADALEAKIAALEEARARERRFTADVAHELRTPLTALVAEASLLADGAERLPPEPRRLAELLAGDVARLHRLVDDLLEISRLDAGAVAVRRERVDVGALVRALVDARGLAGAVRVEGESRAVTDPRRVERIVANLVENAIEHGGGSATVTVAEEPGEVTIAVSDAGPGIAPEALPRVFDRFAKADAARAGAGSGLGLAIAREHARLLGGDVDASSEPGRGSRFTVRLPTAPADAVSEPLHPRDGAVSRARDDEPITRQEEDRR
jgi:signal transduction histidine kinase